MVNYIIMTTLPPLLPSLPSSLTHSLPHPPPPSPFPLLSHSLPLSPSPPLPPPSPFPPSLPDSTEPLMVKFADSSSNKKRQHAQSEGVRCEGVMSEGVMSEGWRGWWVKGEGGKGCWWWWVRGEECWVMGAELVVKDEAYVNYPTVINNLTILLLLFTVYILNLVNLEKLAHYPFSLNLYPLIHIIEYNYYRIKSACVSSHKQ